ncbi:MAG: response regulator [Phycisphaerae bacterium]
MARKRIIVVEDEPDMAGLIANRLRREGYAAEVAHDGREALEMIRADVPALVVLDIMLPVLSGTEVLRELRKDPRTATLPVVMLTAKSAETDVVKGLGLGADDYVTKPFSLPVLVARLTAVLRRAAAAPPAGGVLKIGPIEIDQDRHTVQVAGEQVALTKTEYRLLLALAAVNGKTLTRNQLIDQTIGLDAVVTDRTIDVHLTALRRKLGAARDCIRTVRGVGYCLSGDPNETQ